MSLWLRTVSRNSIIAALRLISFTSVLKFPAAMPRRSAFWRAIDLALSTFALLVAKWSCQKRTSFSCSGNFVLTMYFTHLLWTSSMYFPEGLNALLPKASSPSAA
jgi:hypothetical protein